MRRRAGDSSGVVIVGADLSLTSTALVAVRGTTAEFPHGKGPEMLATRVMNGKDLRGLERLHEIELWTQRFFDDLAFRELRPVAVIFEGPGFSSQVAHALGQLHGVLKLALWRRAAREPQPFLLADVPPATLKKFVSGSGAADKNVVMKRVFARWGFDSDDDNECDAFACTMVGLCRFGGGNQTQTRALTGKVTVYEGPGASVRDEDRAAAGQVAGRARRRRTA